MATIPGIHSDCKFEHFDAEERAAIETISKDWYVTNSGYPVKFTDAVTYKYILVKPTDNIQHAFNLERELICLFSPFDDIHPRTLDAISKAQGHFPQLRVDRICSLVVSKDLKVGEKLKRLLQNDMFSMRRGMLAKRMFVSDSKLISPKTKRLTFLKNTFLKSTRL